jgi:hypothetical protein
LKGAREKEVLAEKVKDINVDLSWRHEHIFEVLEGMS